MATLIPLPNELPKNGNLSDNWRKWRQNFEIYMSASGITSDDPKVCGMFLVSIGQYGRDIFNELEIPSPHKLEDFFTKFDEHCFPKRNLTFDRYTFFNTKQQPNQSFDKFYTLLKQKSLTCEFGELTNSLIATQIIIGISNSGLRKRLLTVPDLTLNDIVEECKTTETAIKQSEKIKASTSDRNQQHKPKKVVDKSLAEQLDKSLVEKLVKHLDLQKSVDKQGKSDGPNPTKKNKGKSGSAEEKKDKHPEGKKNDLKKPSVISNCKFCSGTHPYGNCPKMSKNE